MDLGLHALNLLFWAVHTGLIVFNLFGWIFRRTRLLNLVSLVLTAGSWFGVGLFYGIGYCFLTEWHWQVREAMGVYDNPDTFVELLIRSVTGYRPSAEMVSAISGTAFAVAFACSLLLNIRDFAHARDSRDVGRGGSEYS